MKAHTSAVIVLLSLLALHVSLTTAIKRPSDKPDYSKANETASSQSQPYARYDTVTIYVHARDNVTKQQWTATYWPRVDEFSQLHMLNTNFTGMSFNPNLTIWVELKGYNETLPPKRVYNDDEGMEQLVIPYFTALVLLDKGNVTDFQWDDGCDDYCNPNKDCLDDVCGVHRIRKGKDICNGTVDCNIKIYVAWSGRDKDDVRCRSETSSPSNFRQVSVSPVTTLGDGLWDDFVYKFTTNAPDPSTGETKA